MTELVYPQDTGETQITLTPGLLRGGTTDVLELPLSVEYGLTDAWQVEVEWTALTHHNPESGSTTRGIGELEISTQYSFLNIGGSLFHVAPRIAVVLPLGSVAKEHTEGFIEYEPSVTVARDFPALHHAQLFAQFGVAIVQRARKLKEDKNTDTEEEEEDEDDADEAGEPEAHEFVWSTGFFIPFKHWVASLECSGSNNRWNHGGQNNEVRLTPGLVWKISPSVELGVAVSYGLNQKSEGFKFITQLVYEF